MEAQPRNRFSFFVGRLVRLVFKDGDRIEAKVGRVISVEGSHLEFETHHHRYLIHTGEILKIQDAGEGRAGT